MSQQSANDPMSAPPRVPNIAEIRNAQIQLRAYNDVKTRRAILDVEGGLDQFVTLGPLGSNMRAVILEAVRSSLDEDLADMRYTIEDNGYTHDDFAPKAAEAPQAQSPVANMEPKTAAQHVAQRRFARRPAKKRRAMASPPAKRKAIRRAAKAAKSATKRSAKRGRK